MKKFMTSAVLTLCAALLFSCADKNSNGVIVKGNSSKMDSLSYATGIDLASSLSREMSVVGFDYDAVKKAIETVTLKGGEIILNEDTLNAETSLGYLQDFFSTEFPERMRQKRENEIAKADTTGQSEIVELDFNSETMFKNEEERVLLSTAFGFDIGNNMVKREIPLQLYWLFKGWDEYNTDAAKMTEEESRNYIMEYFTVKVPAENKKASEAWLKKVESEKGVQKTESGLLYKVIEAGDMSQKPIALDNVVEVHYKGTTR
ncbi:MAG: FKBP-type peptidyl-prolyl cis-trans isomerase N-terminal domain-containing protein, partial [Bacteroidaceae bacterium]|nr:FKBP-type peptidyl-prolyl cis-trans isomerase N-terminal domain-containing protein [Bacteroidaceae bacterium]